MRIEKEFLLREIAGDYVIVPVGQTVVDFNGLIMVNPVGVFLWNRMQQEFSIRELTRQVCEAYEVDRETAGKDVEEFVKELQQAGILGRGIDASEEK